MAWSARFNTSPLLRAFRSGDNPIWHELTPTSNATLSMRFTAANVS
jgi:hypothetical protein